MTRRDYIRIAAVLARFSNLQVQTEVGGATAAIAESLANVFAIDNPRFNRDRFLAECDIPARYFESGKEAA